MTLAQYRDPRAAAEKAEVLEVWSRFALFTLIGQIAAIESSDAQITREDKTSLAHCRAIVGALAMLCALSAKVKRQCLTAIKSIGLHALSYERSRDHSFAPSFQLGLDLGYFDSS